MAAGLQGLLAAELQTDLASQYQRNDSVLRAQEGRQLSLEGCLAQRPAEAPPALLQAKRVLLCLPQLAQATSLRVLPHAGAPCCLPVWFEAST